MSEELRGCSWCRGTAERLKPTPLTRKNAMGIVDFHGGKMQISEKQPSWLSWNVVWEMKIHRCPMCGCPLSERARAEQTNPPLTLEELRGMDGEPVYIVEHPDWGHWELSVDAEDYFDCRDPDFYGMKHNDPQGRHGLHMLGWLAYRQKPEGGDTP